jgi:prephenate dehydrogenase
MPAFAARTRAIGAACRYHGRVTTTARSYSPRTLAILGFGRFGQLLARVLKPHFDISVHDRTPCDEIAAQLGVRAVDVARACEADVIVYAVPISMLETLVGDTAAMIGPAQTVLDVCSVKVHPARVFEAHLKARGAQLILTHPLFGPDSASGSLAGLPIALHNLAASPEAFDYWCRLFERLGLATVITTPEAHDREAAYSQGLTHIVGRVLDAMRLVAGPVSTTGFRALLEVRTQTCNDTWQLFSDLQSYNPYTSEMRRDLMEQLANVSAALDGEASRRDSR